MAVWQFDAHVIPRASIEKSYGEVPLTMTREDFDESDWWHDFPTESISNCLSQILPVAQSWHPDVRMWGDESGNRVDVVHEGDTVVDIFVRFDVRDISYSFLANLLEIFQKNDCLLLTEDGYLLRPSVKQTLAAIWNSSASKYISDPEAFLQVIANREKSDV